MNPLVALIPAPMVRFFARPYVAGDSLAAAIDAAVRLQNERGVLATLDLLGEKIKTALERKMQLPPSDLSPLDFLRTVIKDYNAVKGKVG